MKKSFLAAMALTLFFASCKKGNDTPADVTPTVQNLVGTYTLAKMTMVAGSTETDITNQMDACERDDQTKLNANMTYENIDAGQQCGTADSGNWSLSGNTLTMDGYSMTIRRFNGQSLELVESGGGMTIVTYMNKQ